MPIDMKLLKLEKKLKINAIFEIIPPNSTFPNIINKNRSCLSFLMVQNSMNWKNEDFWHLKKSFFKNEQWRNREKQTSRHGWLILDSISAATFSRFLYHCKQKSATKFFLITPLFLWDRNYKWTIIDRTKSSCFYRVDFSSVLNLKSVDKRLKTTNSTFWKKIIEQVTSKTLVEMKLLQNEMANFPV